MAAEVADGWCGVPVPMEEMAKIVGRLHELLEENGKSSTTFRVNAGGIDATTLEDFERLEEIGITDCIVMPWMQDLSDASHEGLELSLNGRIESIHRFGEEIISRMDSAQAPSA